MRRRRVKPLPGDPPCAAGAVVPVVRCRPGTGRTTPEGRPRACEGCAKRTEHGADADAVPVGGARPAFAGPAGAGPGSKYCDHLPLYRQSQIYAREGVTLPRALLASWVGRIANLVAPLVEAIGRHVRAGDALHADDTPVPVLSPGAGKTREARHWVYLRDERPRAGPPPPAVLYRYTPDRKGIHPQADLQGFRGLLHADGYAGFNKLYEPGDDGIASEHEVACWAHVRRKSTTSIRQPDHPSLHGPWS